MRYNDLEIENETTWGMKTATVPVIIGALGLVKKGTKNYTGKIKGNIRITELQNTVLLGTAHILMKILPIKQSSRRMTALSSRIELGTISKKSKALRIYITITITIIRTMINLTQ